AWGALRFSALYFGGGLISAATQFGIDWNENVPTGGSSGAISAVMGAFVVRFATRSIQVAYVAVLFRMWAGRFNMPAIVLGPLWLVTQLYSLFTETDSGVATGAHVGGFAAGAAAAL